MDNQAKTAARQVLSEYLEANGCRKTPERFAILDAVCSMRGCFTFEELSRQLEKNNFRVSRATLYNSLRLFLELKLVTKHHLNNSPAYEANYAARNHCYQVCTECNSISEVKLPEVVNTIEKTRMKRFRRDAFILYNYGVCASCQAKISRKSRSKPKSRKEKR